MLKHKSFKNVTISVFNYYFFMGLCDDVIKENVLYDSVLPRTLPIKCGIWVRSISVWYPMHNTNTFMNYSPARWMEALLNVIRWRKRLLSEISSFRAFQVMLNKNMAGSFSFEIWFRPYLIILKYLVPE